MFDLESSIAAWRQQMLAAGIKTPTPMEELEIHLREDIAASLASGSCEAEAFHSAARKIGPAPAVQTEFKKVETTSPRFNWKFFGIFFGAFTLLFPLMIGSLIYVFKNGNLGELSSGQQLSSLAAAATFSLLAYAFRLAHEKYVFLQTRRIRDAILAPVMLWLVLLAYGIMPHFNLDPAQKSVASLWGLAPFGIVIGWCWAFASAGQKKSAGVNS